MYILWAVHFSQEEQLIIMDSYEVFKSIIAKTNTVRN